MGNHVTRKINRAAKGQTRILRIRKKKVDYSQALNLSHALMNENNRVLSLELYSTNVGLKGFARIIDSFKHPNNHVVRLCLLEEVCGPIGAAFLYDALINNSSLVSLIMQGNALGNDGAMIIAEVLKHPDNGIRVLYLLENQIGHDGIRAICEGLQHENNQVMELSLTGNGLSLESVNLIANVLKHKNNQLQNLRLGHCRLDNHAACALSKALVHSNCKLRNLDLETNYITDTRDLVKAMKLSNLHWIDISFNTESVFEQEKMLQEVRQVFFEKRQYWDVLTLLCAVHDLPSTKQCYSPYSKRQAIPAIRSFPRSLSFALGSAIVGLPEGFNFPSHQLTECYFRMLPKDLIRLLAKMMYPWARSEKILASFIM